MMTKILPHLEEKMKVDLLIRKRGRETYQTKRANSANTKDSVLQGVNSRGKDLLRLSEQPGTSHDT